MNAENASMNDTTFTIDYSGARGSNTGDEFHELWATRQALRLLDTTTGLTAITVEGMTVAERQDRVWDGVDCAAFLWRRYCDGGRPGRISADEVFRRGRGQALDRGAICDWPRR